MIKLHQQTYGQGKPLVLVHGWAMHSGIWRDFALQLAQYYEVTCIDLPGHGRSEKLDEFTLARITESLDQTIRAESSCWLGWSLGASVVLEMAKRHPARVQGLVLLAGNPCFTQTADWPGVNFGLLEGFAGQLAKDCPTTLVRFLSLQVQNLPNFKDQLKALKAAVQECPPPDHDTLQGGLDILKQTDLRPVLAGLNIPVAAILGSHDTLVPIVVGEAMQALAAHIQVSKIDRAGHLPFLSHRDEVLAIISRFMDAL
ncbi:MAG: pimeloyl-ACP methyl ester esterase BioH [Methylococcales bacterium]|nr:pimeloyl-ACP methyl ester esterase BioH [Methylococcales bacterium]